jgi:hypothetical protein
MSKLISLAAAVALMVLFAWGLKPRSLFHCKLQAERQMKVDGYEQRKCNTLIGDNHGITPALNLGERENPEEGAE